MSAPTRSYTKEGVTVDWRPELCTHCEACIQGLPQVFDLTKRPWVDLNNATVDEIKTQVAECPSGALSIR